MKKLILFLSFSFPLIVCFTTYATSSNSTSLVKKHIVHSVGANDGYNAKLLTLALSYSATEYQISEFAQNIPKGRRFQLLNNSNKLHIEVGSATKAREEQYLAIPFPLIKGLNGWRVPLINSANPSPFKNIHTLEAFKALTPIQFHSWSDTKILMSNGINVIKGGNIEGLYQMIHHSRADYFPRSITEIDINIAEHKHLAIRKDDNALIYYPTAFYFYVGKTNHTLATDIKSGLEKALIDGEFDKLFMSYFGTYANIIKKEKRKVFTLSNPFLPEIIPLERRELWVKPDSP